jgi:hypothetical protein
MIHTFALTVGIQLPVLEQESLQWENPRSHPRFSRQTAGHPAFPGNASGSNFSRKRKSASATRTGYALAPATGKQIFAAIDPIGEVQMMAHSQRLQFHALLMHRSASSKLLFTFASSAAHGVATG